jgi:hypothetical protein
MTHLLPPEECKTAIKEAYRRFTADMMGSASHLNPCADKSEADLKLSRLATAFEAYVSKLMNGSLDDDELQGVHGLPPGVATMQISRDTLDYWYKGAADFFGHAIHWVTAGDVRDRVHFAMVEDLQKSKVDINAMWTKFFTPNEYSTQFRSPTPSATGTPARGGTPQRNNGAGGGQKRDSKHLRQASATPPAQREQSSDWGERVLPTPGQPPFNGHRGGRGGQGGRGRGGRGGQHH